MSSGNSLSNDIFSLVVGCKKLRCLACRACLGKFINKLKILISSFCSNSDNPFQKINIIIKEFND